MVRVLLTELLDVSERGCLPLLCFFAASWAVLHYLPYLSAPSSRKQLGLTTPLPYWKLILFDSFCVTNLKPKKISQRITGLYGAWKALRGPAFKILYSSFTISLHRSCRENEGSRSGFRKRKKKKVGGGEETQRELGGGPPLAEKRQGVTCRLRGHPHPVEAALSHTRVFTQKRGLWMELKGEKVQNARRKVGSPVGVGSRGKQGSWSHESQPCKDWLRSR